MHSSGTAVLRSAKLASCFLHNDMCDLFEAAPAATAVAAELPLRIAWQSPSAFCPATNFHVLGGIDESAAVPTRVSPDIACTW